jgi:hypothetical protein
MIIIFNYYNKIYLTIGLLLLIYYELFVLNYNYKINTYINLL